MKNSPSKISFFISSISLILLSFGQNQVSAADTPIQCSPDLAAYQCGVCFDHGYIYEGKDKTSLSDIAINNGSLRNIYFANENADDSIEIKNRGSGAVVYTTPVFDYAPEFFTLNNIKYPSYSTWAPIVHPDGSTQWATIMDPGSSYKWTQTIPGKELFVTSIDKSKINDSNRALVRDANFVTVYKLTAQFRNTSTKTWEGSNTHVECQVTGAHFCGDGVVEPGRETCDDGGQNGQPGKCNTSCDGTVPPVPTPSCDSLSATPLFGNSPLSTSLTCNGSNLPAGAKYAIDCGNGTQAIMNGNVGVCNYTNNSTTDSKTYTPKCVINDTITSNACNDQTRIGVNPMPVSPVCNPSKSGLQTNPVNSTDYLCSTGTPSAFTSSLSGTTTNYSWSCNTATSVNCTASYTSNIVPEGPYVTIKKYVSGSDAQTSSGTVKIASGQVYNYTLKVSNGGMANAPVGTVVVDNMPADIEIIGTPVGTDWACSVSGQTIKCVYSKIIALNSSAPDITISARIRPTAPLDTPIRNVAAVCSPVAPATDCTPNPSECKPTDINYDPTTGKCDPATVTPVLPTITIKKYAKVISDTGDSQTAPISIARGETFNYYYVLENISDTGAQNVMIKDTFPENLSFTGNIVVTNPSGVDVSSDWNCTKGTYSATSRITLVCLKKTDLPGHSGKYIFTVPVSLSLTASLGQDMQNVVYACAKDMTGNPLGPDGNPVCDTTNPPPPPPSNQCDATNPESQKDPACIKVTPSFDLSVKKYVNTDANDAQDAAHALSTTTNASINYIIRVKNNGVDSSTGITTMKDKLPTGVTASGSATGTGWSCSYSGAFLTCISSQVVASGSSYPDITVPVKVTLGAGTSATNYAVVYNPYELNPCTLGSTPTGNETSCDKDPANIDPAVISVPGGTTGGGGGVSLYTPSCVNGIKSCSVNTYSSAQACSDSNGSCYADSVACMNANTLSCVTGPGPGGGGGGCTGPTCYTTGSCGDGVLQGGEECDFGNANSDDGFCTSSCKINFTTHPGANPTDLFITIPGFSNIGYSTLGDLTKSFASNNVVVGKDTNIFTLADSLDLKIITQLDIPLMIPADSKFCLRGIGNAVTNNTICNFASKHSTPINVNGTDYIILGKGMYQERKPDGTYWNVPTPNNSSMTLFKGADISPVSAGGQVTLRDAFKGSGNPGDTGNIVLFNHDPVTDPTGAIDMAAFDVRVSGVMVGSTASVVNRIVDTYLTNKSVLSQFLSGFRAVSGTTSTSTNTNTTTTAPVINVPVGSTSSTPITSWQGLGIYNLNGNQNIFSINGNVTINCKPGETTFSLDGVRTLIVQNGNLTINCNISYPADMGASWAFIVKNGNIIVSSNVTNLAGVYLAIGDGTNNGIFSGSVPTNNILKVEGSMYGNATPLFNSRQYVRGTNAYDTLTPGVILTYSNRALVNPPPLLSEYLNNYTVNKVVK